MKHAYPWARPLLAALFLFIALSADAQQAWRPFRPGLIYGFSGPGSSSVHTLRLDSAYTTTAGDSAWTFKRLVKTSDGREQSINPYGGYRKSRNNLFGARLVWQRTPAAFVLENLAEGSAQSAFALQLRPQAAVGSTWVASSSPALTATLTSRSPQLVGTVLDSVAVITLSSGQVVRLSRTYGLLAAPQWLATAGNTPQWTQALLPITLTQSSYNPTQLFNLQPGDELGYLTQPFTISPFPTSESKTLLRIITRRQTADSLLFTFQQQTREETFFSPTSTAGVQIMPARTGRWALSLRTGKSAQFPALPLLTGEYGSMYQGTSAPLYVGRGLIMNSSSSGCMPSGRNVNFIGLFNAGGSPAGQYNTGIDIGWRQEFSISLGVGAFYSGDTGLIYYRRTLSGTTTTCGSPLAFATLLPTRAAQAAAIATLHPNPAPEAATLTLAQPARAGYALRLTDALGRAVWSAPVAAGQSAVAVPLAGQPAGLYLLHLTGPDGATATWKLTHE
ncbi:hypothetical protein ACVWYF_002781 [Hymenobacter sp. UYAg731]